VVEGGSGNGWKIALAVAAIGAIATISAALITSIGCAERKATSDLTMPSTSNVCPGSLKVKLDADLTDGDANYEIYVFCPPPRSHYVLIGQVEDVDVDPENPHREYYLTLDVREPVVGPHRYPHSEINGYIKDGKNVTYYVISVDDSEFAQLQAKKQPAGFVLKLPVGRQVVSNFVKLPGKR
jgi:hypothetical protein